MSAAIDHLVIAAETLEQGADYIQEVLGVEIPFGGAHPKMGTHNLLMQLGDTQFLEVISIDPNAIAPARPRWFGLDNPHVRHRLKSGPTLLCWVANTQDIKTLTRDADFSFGQPEQISRGNLSWYFGLPQDGRLLAGGLLPYLIEWPTERNPAGSMPDTGCRLLGLTLYHANASWLEPILDSIGIGSQINVKPLAENTTSYLEARLATPHGTRILSSTGLSVQPRNLS